MIELLITCWLSLLTERQHFFLRLKFKHESRAVRKNFFVWALCFELDTCKFQLTFASVEDKVNVDIFFDRAVRFQELVWYPYVLGGIVYIESFCLESFEMRIGIDNQF